MKRNWFILFLLLGGLLSLLAGCTTRTTATPQAGAPAGPPAPTAGGPAPVVPTSPVLPTPVAQETTVAGPTATPRELPPALTAPQLTVLGTLAGGVSWGTTGDGNYFKGDPNAPLVMFEFSDFQ